MDKQSVGMWNFAFENTPLIMSPQEVGCLLDAIQKWEHVFGDEGNAARRVFGKPALLIRMDYALSPDNEVGIYEVEERPCGLGMGQQFHPYFWECFRKLFGRWSRETPIEVVISPHRKESCDDVHWAEALSIPVHHTPDVSLEGPLYWVRADPWERSYFRVIPASLTTISMEGNKEYGKTLGWWNDVPENLEELPWEEGFALKPKQGSRCNVLLVKKSRDAREYMGLHTRKRAEDDIKNGTYAYYQRWIHFEQPAFLPGHSMFRRVFFGWDPLENQWVCMGGFYNARPRFQARLHGATDAVFGPILVP